MEFDEYQKRASATAVFKHDTAEYKLMYLSMGLAGETGEVIEKVKKVIRNDDGIFPAENKELLKKEIGDVLWYLSQLALNLGISFDDAANLNIAKLADRMSRDAITSEGDTR